MCEETYQDGFEKYFSVDYTNKQQPRGYFLIGVISGGKLLKIDAHSSSETRLFPGIYTTIQSVSSGCLEGTKVFACNCCLKTNVEIVEKISFWHVLDPNYMYAKFSLSPLSLPNWVMMLRGSGSNSLLIENFSKS